LAEPGPSLQTKEAGASKAGAAGPEAEKAGKRPGASPGDAPLERCLGELVRFCRHSAVGRRVRGLVHQINTPLQVLSFQLELLEQKAGEEGELLGQGPSPLLPPPAEILESLRRYRLEKIRQARLEVEKLQDLARRLILQGIHEESEERLYLDLNQVYREELELYQTNPWFRHRVEKEFSFDPALPPIYGHYIDFSLSFRHLVDNALEAMEAAPRRVLTVATRLEGGCRVLRVTDTGPGIPPDLLPRIFEPFVTTRGTEESPRGGLGLFLARRLLAPYRGQIQVASRPGETWVTVRLPV
jgi:signal transduction histidine kinase